MYKFNKSLIEYFTAIKLALANLRYSKMRTALSVLGIVIGVVAVVIVVSAGMGVKGYVLDQVQSFGTDFVEIEVKIPAASKTSVQNAARQATGAPITTFKISEAKEVSKMDEVKAHYAAIFGQEIISYKNESETSIVLGVSAGYPDVDDQSKIQSGNFFTQDDDDALAQVAVLGSKMKETLFGGSDPIGKYIKIRGKNFKVIGVLEERGAIMGFDFDKMITLPIQTLQKKVMGIDYIQAAIYKVKDPSQMDLVAAKMNYEMRRLHGISDPNKDDFAVTTMKEAQEIIGTIFNALNLLLIALTFVSLLVGGVGIMNVMYVAVLERTFEIGLRKAVGASSANIRHQFLFEAVVITLMGAFFGVLIAIILLVLLSLAAKNFGFDVGVVVSPMAILLAAGFSSVIGILFGYLPAKKAAQLSPLEAMRR